jgi:AraC-like DNA-binding protein
MFKKKFGMTPTEWRRLHRTMGASSEHAR